MTGLAQVSVRNAFSRSTAALQRPLQPSLMLTGGLPWQHTIAPAFTRTLVARSNRQPTWSEIGLMVLYVATLAAGLIFFLLERSALYLDRQMEHIATSRESSSPVTTTAP